MKDISWQRLHLVCALMSVHLLTGCALLTRGTDQTIYVNSNPQGVVYTVDNKRGIAPSFIRLKRNQDHYVAFVDSSGKTIQQVAIRHRSGGMKTVIGNFWNGFILGNFIDTVSGARYILQPTTVYIDLNNTFLSAPPALPPPPAISTRDNAINPPPIPGADAYTSLNIAVADLEAEGVGSSDAVIVTNYIRGELVRNSRLSVVERKNMQKVLSEHSFQQVGCTNQECAVKLGKLLNVQRMVVGTFGRLLSTYVVSISVINVETGRIIYADDAIISGARNLGAKLAVAIR